MEAAIRRRKFTGAFKPIPRKVAKRIAQLATENNGAVVKWTGKSYHVYTLDSFTKKVTQGRTNLGHEGLLNNTPEVLAAIGVR